MTKGAAVLIAIGLILSLVAPAIVHAQRANVPTDEGPTGQRRPTHGRPLTSPRPRSGSGASLVVEDKILVAPMPPQPGTKPSSGERPGRQGACAGPNPGKATRTARSVAKSDLTPSCLR